MTLCGNNTNCGIEYIGARYVPIFSNPIEWVNNKSYEALTIVINGGNSYTSKTHVPIGVDINNELYWAITGNYNAQVENYRKEVAEISKKLESRTIYVETIDALIKFDCKIGSIIEVSGYYTAYDGGYAKYLVETTKKGYSHTLNNGLYANFIGYNITTKQYGIKDNVDSTVQFQTLINLCALNSFKLIISVGNLVTKTVTVTKPLHITGENSSTYNISSIITLNNGDIDMPLFVFEETPTKSAKSHIENIYLARQRTIADGYPANVFATGKTGTAIEFKTEECLINNVTFVGYGVAIKNPNITDIDNVDIIYCETCIYYNVQVNSTTTLSGANCYENGNIFLFEKNIGQFNVVNSWIESFNNYVKLKTTTVITVISFNTINSTLTNSVHGNAYLDLSEFNPTNFSRLNFNFNNSYLTVKNNLLNSLFTNTEFNINLLNTSMLIGGSLGTTSTVYISGNCKYYDLTGKNKDSLNTIGLDFTSGKAYTPLILPTSNPDISNGLGIDNERMLTFRNKDKLRMGVPPTFLLDLKSEKNPTLPSPDGSYFIYNITANSLGDVILWYKKAGGGLISVLTLT